MSTEGKPKPDSLDPASLPQLFGHPTGLYTLFFAEMWERFSYYGMRALLTLYLIKGFLGYGDSQAYTVYGAYTALVYMTPFIGGLLADKVLGKRIAVVIGGVLMAAGHLLMTIESEWPFFFALALLIAGNGFFKPNISTMVGGMYGEGDKRRDDGFNIFYMGINLGAAMSPLLCGFIGETYGWHYGFGLATLGMLVGLAVFVMPNLVTSGLIFLAALVSSFGLIFFRPDNVWAIGINIFVAVCLMVAAVVACMALNKGGLPKELGGRPEGADTSNDLKVYLGVLVAVPIFALLVSGFSPFTQPPVDVLTGEPMKPATKEELLKKKVSLLKGFDVEDKVLTTVEDAGIKTEQKVRGKSYTLIDEDFIKDVKGISDKPLNAIMMKMFLAKNGQEVAEDATPIDIMKKMAESKLKLDKKLPIDEYLESLGTTKDDMVAAIEKRFNMKLTAEQTKVMFEGKEGEKATGAGIVKVVNKARATFAGSILGIFLEEVSKPAGLVLTLLGLLAFGYLLKETYKLDKIARERMIAAFILIFFQMLFFAFFEQAGSSINIFTDRNIDRVGETSNVTEDMVGETIRLQPTQAQLGYERNGKVFTLDDLEALRNVEKEHPELGKVEISWKVSESNKGMGIASRLDELPASIFQSFNAIFILIFALIFNRLWAFLRSINKDPGAGIKFGLGLLQLGLGFGAFWMGAQNCDSIGMVSITWLTLGILLHTTGELCLSPVGLSTMTKLSPKALVSTLMGAWFLATAFSQYLAAVISQFTSVEESGGFPPPSETVNIYGDVFGKVALVAMGCGAVCILLSPLLTYWMHQDKVGDESAS